MTAIKDENGIYVELPKEKIKFVSKEAEVIFDLSMENDYLQKENQELKKHLEVPETCSLKTLEDYKSYYEDTNKEKILEDTYIDYCAYVNLAHRYSELKKQLEDMTLCRDIASGHRKEVQDRETRLLKQQKEFIEYMENEIKELEEISVSSLEEKIGKYFLIKYKKEILSKYKEIIGVKDER